MLSIRFGGGREWWTSSGNFERLFSSAIHQGALDPELEEWRHVAAANGGFDVDELDAETRDRLVSGLRATAHRDLAALTDVVAGSPDDGYRVSLGKFLEAIG